MNPNGSVLRVDTGELLAKSENAYECIERCREALAAISDVLSSDDFWRGDAGDFARQVFAHEMSATMAALDNYATYPEELLRYYEIHSAAIEAARAIASDVSDYSI